MDSLIVRFFLFCGLVALTSTIYAVPYLTIDPQTEVVDGLGNNLGDR